MISRTVKNNLKVQGSQLFADRVLSQIKEETKAEVNLMNEAFELMGWQKLNDEIKMAIYDDVKYMVMELQGLFSSCDEFVQRRRDSVHFWISSFLDGICDEKMVLENLQIK